MRKGFTLIEVLVVVAVIALLLSILMPSMAAVRAQARLAVCSSNLRGMALAVRMYAQESQDWLPTAEPPMREFPDSRHWFMNASLLKRMDTPLRTTNDGEPLGPPATGTIMICPAHEESARWRNGTELTYGLSYGMNGTWGLGGRPDHYDQRRMTEFTRESEVMVFMDAWGEEAAPGIVLYRMCPKDNIQFRHRGRTNVAFLDGHISTYTQEQVPFGMENRYLHFWSSRKP